MNKKELINVIVETQNKYFDLVWYARARRDSDNEILNQNIERIRKMFPNEINELNLDKSNWCHGFNSGMLAGLRYILELDYYGKEHADENFPFLDT